MDPEANEETTVSDPSDVRSGGGSEDAPQVGDAPGGGVSTSGGATTVSGSTGNAQASASTSSGTAPAGKKSSRSRPNAGTHPNNVRKLRQRAMMSKAELARRAGVSPLTIDRVESGCPCRMDTKRKILEALGIAPASAADVFPDVDLG